MVTLNDIPSLVKVCMLMALASDSDSAAAEERAVIRALVDGADGEIQRLQDQVVFWKEQVQREREKKHAAAEDAFRRTVAVTFEEAFDVPAGFYVYTLWDESRGEQPLYVGQSRNLLARIGAHMSSPRFRDAVSRIQVRRCLSQADMDLVETALIRTLRPAENIKDNGRYIAERARERLDTHVTR